MRTSVRSVAALAIAPALLLLGSAAFAQRVVIPAGTQVPLVFDQAMSSKTAKAGDRVALHVSEPVMVGNHVVIREGTKVYGVVTKVDKRKRFGVNARMQFALDPVKAVNGETVQLDLRQKGKVVGGRTGEAAAASGAGALILGPVGLVGGYFVVGKPVNIKPGDRLVSQVSSDVVMNGR